MKRLLLSLIFASGYLLCYAQQSEINFLHQNINFSAPPRTTISPMSIKMWDNYGNGGPSDFGTVLEFYGLSSHQTGQLYFGGWDNSKMRYREAFYNENTWSSWVTLLDSKNNLESAGNLMLSGTGNHFINGGNVGIGISSPGYLLHLRNTQPTLNFEKTGALNWIIGNVAGNDFYIKADNAPSSPFMIESGSGNVGIGIATPREKLSVNGKIRAHEVKVETANWPDYVFEDYYKPKTLTEIENFIKVNKHLPEVPSAKEVEKSGVELGEMNKILLKKIEELTLLLIEQNKKNEQQDKLIEALLKKNK